YRPPERGGRKTTRAGKPASAGRSRLQSADRAVDGGAPAPAAGPPGNAGSGVAVAGDHSGGDFSLAGVRQTRVCTGQKSYRRAEEKRMTPQAQLSAGIAAV